MAAWVRPDEAAARPSLTSLPSTPTPPSSSSSSPAVPQPQTTPERVLGVPLPSLHRIASAGAGSSSLSVLANAVVRAPSPTSPFPRPIDPPAAVPTTTSPPSATAASSTGLWAPSLLHVDLAAADFDAPTYRLALDELERGARRFVDAVHVIGQLARRCADCERRTSRDSETGGSAP
jgi:hypothetical protein